MTLTREVEARGETVKRPNFLTSSRASDFHNQVKELNTAILTQKPLSKKFNSLTISEITFLKIKEKTLEQVKN